MSTTDRGGTLDGSTARPPEGDVVTVVGIGADGWPGLGESARQAVAGAQVLVGSTRQTDLVTGRHHAAVVPLPVPLRAGLGPLLERHAGARVVVLASGDPMHYGIGRTLAEVLGPQRLRVLPQASSMSLACARLGWGLEDVDVVSAVGRPVEQLALVAHPGRRLLVLSRDGETPAQVARLLVEHGLGASRVHVLADLGAPDESVTSAEAARWAEAPAVGALNVVAVECRAQSEPVVGLVPGLADEAYETDGQLTKRHVRAATLAALAPRPGELLWDVGAGTGTVGIEWMRAHPTCRTVAVEPREDRAARIARNAARLGVPALRVVHGRAPESLDGLPVPDAVFVGGGLTAPGLVETVLAALRPGGRLVVNTVTLDSETRLFGLYRRYGGSLTRLETSHASAVGGFTAWRPARPVTQWALTRPEELPS